MHPDTYPTLYATAAEQSLSLQLEQAAAEILDNASELQTESAGTDDILTSDLAIDVAIDQAEFDWLPGQRCEQEAMLRQQVEKERKAQQRLVRLVPCNPTSNYPKK